MLTSDLVEYIKRQFEPNETHPSHASRFGGTTKLFELFKKRELTPAEMRQKRIDKFEKMKSAHQEQGGTDEKKEDNRPPFK